MHFADTIKRQENLLACSFEFEKEKNLLKPEIIAEASLSLEHPIVVKANNVTINIGSKEEFLYRRLAIQASQKDSRRHSLCPFRKWN